MELVKRDVHIRPVRGPIDQCGKLVGQMCLAGSIDPVDGDSDALRRLYSINAVQEVAQELRAR